MAPRRKNQVDVNLDGRADLTQLLKELDKLRSKIGQVEGDIKKTKGEITGLERAGGFLKSMGEQGVGTLGSMVAGGFTSGAIAMRTKAGLDAHTQRVIQMDAESRTVKALTTAYEDYRNAVIEAGRAHGYSNNDVQALASMDARMTGRAGASQRVDNLRLQQGFGRAFGMGATEAGSYFVDAGRRGITTGGGDVSPRQFAGLIADATVQGRMQGREGELASSLTNLTSAINSKSTGIQGTASAASWLSTLNATGIRGLQGEGGAQILGKVNNAIQNPNGEAGNLFLYRALTDNKGGMALSDYEYLKEEGLAGVANKRDGKSNFQRILEASHDEGQRFGGRYGLMVQREALGVSMHEAESLNKAFIGPDGKFNTAKMGALESRFTGKDFEQTDASTWGLLAELANKPGNNGTLESVRREFEELSGTKTTAKSTDELFNEIKAYGQGNVLMSEGQQREKIDNDRDKAYEAAGAKLYDLVKAATQLETKFVELTGSMPGVLGGIMPSLLGGLASGGLTKLGGWGMGKLFSPVTSALGMGGQSLLGSAPIAGGGAAAGAAGGSAAGAAGGGAAATTGAAGGGLVGVLGGLAAIGGGIGIGSLFASKALGTRGITDGSIYSDAGKGLGRVFSSQENGGASFGEMAKTTGGVLLSPFAAITGLAHASAQGGLNLLGMGNEKGFKENYYNGFDSVMLDTGSTAERNQQRRDEEARNSFGSRLKRTFDDVLAHLADSGDPVAEKFAEKFTRGMDNVQGPGGGGFVSRLFGAAQGLLGGLTGGGGIGGGGGGGAPQGFGGNGFDASVNSMVAGGKVISGWGDDRKSTMGKLGKKHEGIDIQAAYGSDIRALKGGEVVYSQWNEFGGNALQVKDEEGRMHYYAHMVDPSRYKVGDRVDAGQTIGQVGTTGQGKPGSQIKGVPPHLHYQVSDVNGNWVDPKLGLADECVQCDTNIKADVQKVNAVLKGTGMEGKGQLIVDMAQKTGVPVELALAMFRKEASFADKKQNGGRGTLAWRNNNPGNLKFTGKWGDSQGEGGFGSFKSMDEGIEGFFNLLGTNYRDYLDKGDYGGLINEYAPPSENNTDQYKQQMQEWMGEYGQQIKSSAGGDWRVNKNRMQMVHRDETILPANIAGSLRSMVERRPTFSLQQAQQGALQIQVSFEPLEVRYPDGTTYTTQVRGQARQPFQGILNYSQGGIA